MCDVFFLSDMTYYNEIVEHYIYFFLQRGKSWSRDLWHVSSSNCKSVPNDKNCCWQWLGNVFFLCKVNAHINTNNFAIDRSLGLISRRVKVVLWITLLVNVAELVPNGNITKKFQHHRKLVKILLDFIHLTKT
jgi:hypothetical protein